MGSTNPTKQALPRPSFLSQKMEEKHPTLPHVETEWGANHFRWKKTKASAVHRSGDQLTPNLLTTRGKDQLNLPNK